MPPLSPPRRVLMTTDAVGGVWTFSLELARGLAAQGTATVLAVLGPAPQPRQRAEAACVPGLKLVALPLDLEWRDRTGPLSPEARRFLREAARAAEAEIVHVNGFREAAAGYDVPVVAVAHSCVRTWWAACRRGVLPAEWAAYGHGVREGLDASAAVVAPTAAFLVGFEAAWGAVAGSRVIPNGIAALGPMPVGKEDIILAAGRLWDEAKNIAALGRVADDLPWPVLVAGAGAALWPGVRPQGELPRDELRHLMGRAAIFVSPARYEPFGLAVLEAAAAGCALVLADTPTFHEVWKGAAVFVDPDDETSLVHAIEGLCARPGRQALQRAARARAARYSAARVTDSYRDLYARLAAPGEARRAA
jgi:glycogen(starch) synthase